MNTRLVPIRARRWTRYFWTMTKINLGCGWRNFGSDWVHIDGGDYEHLDHDDIFDFPYENVDLIYASHVIEYFNQARDRTYPSELEK